MRETPLDTLDRARDVFAKSLTDGVGRADAGAEFFLQAVSAERHGYLLGADDEALIKMFYAVIRKEDEGATGTQGAVDLANDMDEGMQESGVSQYQIGYDISHGAGMGLAPNPSYDENRIVPPEPTAGSLVGHHVQMVDGHEDDPYRAHDVFGPDFNPLHGRMGEHLAGYYVADDPYGESVAQQHHGKEGAWEDEARDGLHSFLRNVHHLGKLDTEHATNHSLYEHDYRDWSVRNSSDLSRVRQQLEEEGLNEDEIEHRLRQAHIKQKQAEWDENLGFFDYLFGMEWLTPEERAKAYEYMREHGAARHEQNPLRFGRHTNDPDFMPRFKRSFWQRFSPLYDWWVRDPKGPGEGMMNRPIRLPEAATEYTEKRFNLDALRSHRPDVGGAHGLERAYDSFNRFLDTAARYEGIDPRQVEKYRMVGGRVPVLNPDRDEEGNESPLSDASGNFHPLKLAQIGSQQEMRPRAKGDLQARSNGLGELELRLLLGIDMNGKLYEEEKHPLWGNLWMAKDQFGNPVAGLQPEFTQEEIDSIMRERLREGVQTAAPGRAARSHAIGMYGTYVDPDAYGWTEDHDSLKTYFAEPYLGMGGLHKNPNELFNILHHASLLFSPKQQQQSQDESEALRGFSLADFGIEEEEVPEEEAEYEAQMASSRGNRGGKREESLLFSRTGNGIMHRHDPESDSAATMEPFLGPFGQRQLQMANMAVGDKTIQTNTKGSDVDAIANLSPHHVLQSSSQQGTFGFNSQTTRHNVTVDSAHANRLQGEYHNARESGDRDAAQAAHDAMRGLAPEHIKISNPFGAEGGALSDETFNAHGAYHYYDIAHRLGFGRAPMDPQREPLEHGSPLMGQPPLRNPDEMQRLSQRVAVPEEANFEAAKAALDEEYERYSKLAGDSEEKQQALKEEYERRLARLQSEHALRPYPDEEALYGTESFSMPEQGGMFGALQGGLVPRLSMPSPLKDNEEEYFRLVDASAQVQEALDATDDPTRRKQLQSELIDLNQQMDVLESTLGDVGLQVNVGSTKGTAKMATVRATHQKLRGDTQAIAEAGAHLKDVIGTTDPDALAHIFDPSLPHATVEANMRQWARMANDYLNRVPHRLHGIHTLGTTEFSEAGSQAQTGFGTDVKRMVHDAGQVPPVDPQMILSGGVDDAVNAILDTLELDPNDPRHVKMAEEYLEHDMFPRMLSGQPTAPVMTLRQVFKQMHPDIDIDFEIRDLRKRTNRGRADEIKQKVQALHRTFGVGAEERNAQLGLSHTLAYNPDDRGSEDFTKKRSSMGNAKQKLAKYEDEYFNTLQQLDSIITGLPEVEPAAQVMQTRRGMNAVPVDKFGPNTHSVMSLYNSAGYRHGMGRKMQPNFDFRIKPDGTVSILPVQPGALTTHLVQPLESFWNKVAPAAWMHMLRHPDHADARAALNTAEHEAAEFKVNSVGMSRNSSAHNITMSESGLDVQLAGLTNPDVIRKELGKKVPLLQPMHRIFDLDDLEHLRGFTGDWVVSTMPEGERGFVKKEDDKVTSDSFSLSDKDKENFTKVASEDYHVDVIKLEDGYYIFDVIEFDEKEVHDVPLNDRMKILRGAMEGVQNIHIPSASDTRLTDDAGLKVTVENLQKDDEPVLLRDAKSVYMAGEMRHPKWVLLKPGKDVVLRVLERRGEGPYTYRLGTGPVTREEHIGSRAVESDGETYMDVGAAFNSPEKFNEGDHVRVNVANVSKVEGADNTAVYTLTGSEIEGEAEGEGLVSQETLSMLAKAEDQWLCEVTRAPGGIRVSMPQGHVLYKCTQSGPMWTAHSPLADSTYLVRLAESQRPYWSPVAGAMLKADVDIKEMVEEDEDEFGEAKPLIKPKKVQGTSWWEQEEKVKAMRQGILTLERFLKSGIGAVGASNAGAKGLGFDYATPIESPMGPTNLHDEKTMPDFDNRKRPGEDSDIEEESEDSEPAKHMVIPTEEGVLEVTDDKAVFRM